MYSKKAIWSDYSVISDYPELNEDIVTKVAIIGGGITGISTGLLLAQMGVKVVVLESYKVGGGVTAHSTGNLYFTIDKILASLKSKYDEDVVQMVTDSRMQALDIIKSWVNELQLDCDFKQVPWYLYSNMDESLQKIDEEFQIGTKVGLPFIKAEDKEIPFPHKKAIKLLSQNQINPMQYVQELARAAKKQNCDIYEYTHIDSVERIDDRFVLNSNKANIEAEYVIHATHTPKGVMKVQTMLGPYREYGIACRLDKEIMAEGIYWGYHENGKISTRTYNKNDDHFLIVVGEPHKTGQATDNRQHIQNLENFANKYFNIKKVEYRWGGQHYRPADLLPYIGPVKKGSKELIATGYSTDGLIYGTLAAMILTDEIAGRQSAWDELYDASRNQPIKSAEKFLKENANVAKQYVKDYTDAAIDADDLILDDLQSGEGRIVSSAGKRLAVYRNKNNELEVVSAVCTHMKCIVHWNNAEDSWDCPCHGSRFSTDGSVLEGPAFEPLKKFEL